MSEISELEIIRLHIEKAIEEKTAHFLVCKTRPKNILDIIVDDLIPEARDMYYVWTKEGQELEEFKRSLKNEGYQIIAEHEVLPDMTPDELFDLVVN